MREVGALLSIEEAQRLILERARPLESEPVAFDAAAGRVLAEPAASRVDLPPFDSSAMDGFALRSSDTPGRLPVRERIPAGKPAGRSLEPGEAMGIATGGAVPEGPTRSFSSRLLSIKATRSRSRTRFRLEQNVRPRGGDIRLGDVVVEAGELLGAAQIGALAAAGVPEVSCSRRPRAAVLATGTELRRPGEQLEPGQIYEANSALLAAQLRSAGAEVELLEAVEDDEAAHRAALEAGLRGDVLVTSGGVSVGPHDLVRSVGAGLGVEEVLWGVAVKPGKPLWFGVRDRTLVFGLPGNPVSCLVGFEIFVRPALLALQGATSPLPRFDPGRLARAVRPNAARTELMRARTAVVDSAVELDVVTGQESHMIARAAGADALVLVPPGTDELPAGTTVSYLRLA